VTFSSGRQRAARPDTQLLARRSTCAHALAALKPQPARSASRAALHAPWCSRCGWPRCRRRARTPTAPAPWSGVLRPRRARPPPGLPPAHARPRTHNKPTCKNAYMFRRQTRCVAQVLTTMSTACNEARGQVELTTRRLPCCIGKHEMLPLHRAAQPGGSRHTLTAASSPCAAAWAAWSAPVAHFRRAAAAACRTQAQEAMLMFCYRQTRGCFCT